MRFLLRPLGVRFAVALFMAGLLASSPFLSSVLAGAEPTTAPRQERSSRVETRSRRLQWSAALHSMVVPGWGQHLEGRHGDGWGYSLLAAGAGAFLVATESARSAAVDEYEAARRRYRAALTQEEMDTARRLMTHYLEQADDKKKLRDYGWVALAGVWTFNVVDAALGRPAARAGIHAGVGRLGDGSPAVALRVGR